MLLWWYTFEYGAPPTLSPLKILLLQVKLSHKTTPQFYWKNLTFTKLDLLSSFYPPISPDYTRYYIEYY